MALNINTVYKYLKLQLDLTGSNNVIFSGVYFASLILKEFFTHIKEYYYDSGYNDLFSNGSRSGSIFYRYPISLFSTWQTK
jgi:hypothetical protein